MVHAKREFFQGSISFLSSERDTFSHTMRNFFMDQFHFPRTYFNGPSLKTVVLGDRTHFRALRARGVQISFFFSLNSQM